MTDVKAKRKPSHDETQAASTEESRQAASNWIEAIRNRQIQTNKVFVDLQDGQSRVVDGSLFEFEDSEE